MNLFKAWRRRRKEKRERAAYRKARVIFQAMVWSMERGGEVPPWMR